MLLIWQYLVELCQEFLEKLRVVAVLAARRLRALVNKQTIPDIIIVLLVLRIAIRLYLGQITLSQFLDGLTIDLVASLLIHS